MKNSAKISKILVFSEEARARIFVGEITQTSTGYSFQYDEKYMSRSSATPLGPDLAFSLQPIKSKTFFESLRDLIPSKANPAYKEYCQSVGIDPEESDPMILLVYLGSGPSSFLFEAAPNDDPPTGKQIISFRNLLGLSQRQFSKFLDIPFPTLQAVEKETAQARTTRRLIQIYLEDAPTLGRLLTKRGIFLTEKHREAVDRYIQDKKGK